MELKRSEAAAESKLHTPSDRVLWWRCSGMRTTTNAELSRTAPELFTHSHRAPRANRHAADSRQRYSNRAGLCRNSKRVSRISPRNSMRNRSPLVISTGSRPFAPFSTGERGMPQERLPMRKILQKQAAEQTSQHANREEEIGPTRDPTRPIGRKTATGNDTM